MLASSIRTLLSRLTQVNLDVEGFCWRRANVYGVVMLLFMINVELMERAKDSFA
jgi:hypothetical protein